MRQRRVYLQRENRIQALPVGKAYKQDERITRKKFMRLQRQARTVTALEVIHGASTAFPTERKVINLFGLANNKWLGKVA